MHLLENLIEVVNPLPRKTVNHLGLWIQKVLRSVPGVLPLPATFSHSQEDQPGGLRLESPIQELGTDLGFVLVPGKYKPDSNPLQTSFQTACSNYLQMHIFSTHHEAWRYEQFLAQSAIIPGMRHVVINKNVPALEEFILECNF